MRLSGRLLHGVNHPRLLTLSQSLWVGRAVRLVGLVAVVLFFVGGAIDRPAWVIAAPFAFGVALSLKVAVMLSLGAVHVGPDEPAWRDGDPRAFYGLVAFHVGLAVLAFGFGLYLALR